MFIICSFLKSPSGGSSGSSCAYWTRSCQYPGPKLSPGTGPHLHWHWQTGSCVLLPLTCLGEDPVAIIVPETNCSCEGCVLDKCRCNWRTGEGSSAAVQGARGCPPILDRSSPPFVCSQRNRFGPHHPLPQHFIHRLAADHQMQQLHRTWL